MPTGDPFIPRMSDVPSILGTRFLIAQSLGRVKEATADDFFNDVDVEIDLVGSPTSEICTVQEL